MMAAVRAIAAGTVREAVRSRLAWLLAALLGGAVALSGFLQAVLPAEGRATQAALLGAVLRLSTVCVIAVFTVTAVAREYQDRQVDLLLALPWPRGAWLLGRLAGCCAVALPAALLAGALAALVAPAGQAVLWSASLLAEACIVAAFALFCTVTLQHALPALCTTFGFYALARSAAALQLAGHGGVPDAGQRAIAAGIDAIAFLLPRLDAFARSEWLMYGTGGWADAGRVAAQTAIYVTLLGAAALFDVYRKEF